jgi:hypothetical protein
MRATARCSSLSSTTGIPRGRNWSFPFGIHCRRTNFARYRFCFSRSTRPRMFAASSPSYSCALTRSTPLAAFFRTQRQLSWRNASLSIPYRSRNRCLGSRRALSAIPRREVGRRVSGPSCPAPVSCAGCEPLSTASPCGRLSRPLSTTSGSDARALVGAPRGAAYLGVPQEPLGPPKFSTLLSTHPALFVDPGRPSGTSP